MAEYANLVDFRTTIYFRYKNDQLAKVLTCGKDDVES
jgi:hypothetical protein